jgi:hypothetical protein
MFGLKIVSYSLRFAGGLGVFAIVSGMIVLSVTETMFSFPICRALIAAYLISKYLNI